MTGRPPSGPGCQPSASASISVESSLSGIPSAEEVIAALHELTMAVANNDALLDDDRTWGAFSHAINLFARIPMAISASAIEARRAETQGGYVEDESATAESRDAKQVRS